MDYNVLLGILGGLGIGSILNSIISNSLIRKQKIHDRLYDEKRAAYIGLLTAIHKAAVAPSNETSKEYALWQTQCALFGEKEVSHYAQLIVDTNDGPRQERNEAFNNLISAMRKDLKK